VTNPRFNFNNPEDWHFAAIVYLHPPGSEEYADFWADCLQEMAGDNNSTGDVIWGWDEAVKHAAKDSRFMEKGTCDHCGTHFRYGAAYINAAGEYAIVGNQCASRNLNLTAHEYQDKKIRRSVKAAKTRIEGEMALATLAPNRRIALDFDHHIIKNIKSNFRTWRSLSLKQWALVKKIAMEAAEKAEARANEPEPVEIPLEMLKDRHIISGVILSTKTVDTGYGLVTKMLVRADLGFKIWGTCPLSIEFECDAGDRIIFTASILTADNDKCFGYFKRPSKASIHKGEQA
jgi:hypothetical protein